MRLSCLQENLSRGLAIVGRAVATRTTLPILQNVLLTTDGGRLKVSATNLEIAITTWVGAMVEEEGSLTVPAKLLTDFVSSLPAETIEIVGSQRPKALQLKCARFDARINGTDAEEFPPIPAVEEGLVARIDPKALALAITQSAFAAATEESRPVLTGIKVELEGDRLTLAAADGFRLSVRRGPLQETVGEAVGVIVPARTLNELNRFLADQDEPVEVILTPSRGQVLFRLKGIEIVSQLIQGTFPNYSQLIPQSFQTRAVINVPEFLRATRTASIFAWDGSGIIRLQLTPGPAGAHGQVSISSRAEELGDNVGQIDAAIEGQEAKIAFNSKYLNDVLSVMDTEQVALEITTPSSPGVFRPVGPEKRSRGRQAPEPTVSDNYVHVVMPMFVQW